LRALITQKNESDLKILAGEDPDHGGTDSKRLAESRTLRFSAYQTLMQDVLAVLTPEQKRAFETGIEDAADVERLFSRRRYAADRWSLDRDLWDNDADRVPLATAEEE
jgi:methylase of polypeptide subunit release factors